MTRVKSIIVDDEFLGSNNLKELLHLYCPQIDVVGIANSAKQARKLVEEMKPSAVFLDVNMPMESGFDFLESYDERDFSVVFTTADHEHAIKAFKVEAIDYLLKPIDIDDLQKAVQKLQQKYIKDSLPLKNKEEEELFKISTAEGIELVQLKDIIYLSAENNYTIIHCTDNKKYIVSQTIKNVEQQLKMTIFFRIHKSFIVNFKNHVSEIIKHSEVLLSNGIQLPLARRRAKEFIQTIN